MRQHSMLWDRWVRQRRKSRHTGRNAGDCHQCLAGATADVRPGDRQNQFHGAAVSCGRTREPFLMFVVAGEATNSRSVTPSATSTKPVPRMPIPTLRWRARPCSTVISEVVNDGIRGYEDHIRLVAADDIRLDAHAHPQRCVVG